ncbi:MULTISPECIES: hypothetical protein [unclassified Neglectibacter]|nr:MULTISPECIES: hypothetical protein [unclassified Neglectibacter]
MTEPKYTAQQAAEGVLFYDTLKSVPEDKQDIVARSVLGSPPA